MDHRIPVNGSLHAALLRSHPDIVRTRASKATLVATSHLIEELAARTPGHNVLVSGFQHGRNWAAERDRYLALEGQTDVIAVFAGREPPRSWETDHIAIRLQPEDDLAQEWFVLALGPGLAVTLCGLDAPAAGTPGLLLDEGDRVFETIWSFDPHVAEHAIGVVLDAVAESAPERLADVRARLADRAGDPADIARAADLLTGGMLEKVEGMRRRQKLADRRASEAKTTFLSRMGHELRNPLNAVLGYAQLLAFQEEGGDVPARIERAGRHLLRLVDEVLDISQVESGELKVNLEDVTAGELVEAAIELIGPTADARSMRVSAPLGELRSLRARVDVQLAVEVLVNLLSNAVKYAGEGTVVRVSGTQDAAACTITVADAGPGIPAADLERIFEPFERLPQTEASATGNGLGLALSRTMAHAMGGRIDVASTEAGSQFSLVVPAA